MQKMNLYMMKYLLLLIPIGLISCVPELREGKEVTISNKQAGKYWKADQAEVGLGDTVILSKPDAQLISRFTVKNFTLSADIFTTEAAEGTLDFHTRLPGDNLSHGYSVKINNSDYRSGAAQKTGSLSLIRNNYVRMIDNGSWFRLKVEVMGNSIRVFVNDKCVSEYVQPSQPFRIEGLQGRVLSSGLIILKKTNASGSIKISHLSLTAMADDMAWKPDSMIMKESLQNMITVLNQQDFPVIDFHGHLKGGLTVDQVAEHGRNLGYNYGLAPNCGLNFPVTNDSSLLAYYQEMAPEPVFKAMQCEGREWITLFSPEPIAKYDYIFTDAMTWTDHKNRRLRLWIPEETFVDNEQQFMDMLVGKIEAVLSQEPVDIYVNPTYLPEVIAGNYDRLWTPERMDRVIRVLVEHDVALEINARFKIPNLAFVKRAKEAGVKFTLGTNNAGSDDLGALEYSLMILQAAGITPNDMFIPRPAGDKKVMKQGLPAKITG